MSLVMQAIGTFLGVALGFFIADGIYKVFHKKDDLK
jgi:hypothetical protein